ncbi:MAG: hypothetical protein FIB07_03055 [Candidatus Methanoperedens sp.]|nr:hypothetical protein [Candidatus Methanoperedens sp.]
MSDTTTVRIDKGNLERLRENYPDKSFNDIIDIIVTEESFMSRQLTNNIQNQNVALFIGTMKKKFPGISHQEIIKKCLNCLEISPIPIKEYDYL